MKPDPIRTERLRLRPLDLADAPRIARFAGDPAVARMTPAFPLQQTVVGAEGWVLLHQAMAAHEVGAEYAIELPGEGLIGTVGAHQEGDAIVVRYWLGRPYWGRGFATEAARAVTDVAHALDQGPVRAGHFVDNPASGRVLEKVGFVYTGEVARRFSLGRGQKAELRVMQHHGTA
jgi:RimJ/RimL family protein N-acetyltransferase